MKFSPKAKFAQCDQCPLANQPFVPSNIIANAQVVVISDAPGIVEIRQQKTIAGEEIRLIDTSLQMANIDPETAFKVNTVLCYTGRSEDGKKDLEAPDTAINCCRPRLYDEIKTSGAQVGVSLGNIAAKALLPAQVKTIKITKFRGTRLLHDELKIPITYTVHPAYVLGYKEAARDFRTDFGRILSDTRQVNSETTYEVITNAKQLQEILAEVSTGAEVAYDLETESLDPYQEKEIISLGLSWVEGHSYLIKDYLLKHKIAQPIIQKFLARTDIIWIGTNLKFDNKWLMQYDYDTPKKYVDTMLLHYALDERRGTHGLKEQGRELLGAEDWETDVKKYTMPANRATTKIPVQLPNGLVAEQTLMQRKGYRVIPEEILFKYAARDVDINRQILAQLQPELDKNPQAQKLYDSLLLPSSLMLEKSEHRGLRIDRPLLDKTLDEFTQEIAKLEGEMHGQIGRYFNPGSPLQLRSVLFEDLKLEVIKKTDKGAPSTDGDTLDTLAEMYPDIQFMQTLTDWRAVSRIVTTYLRPILFSLDRNGRCHASILLHGTVSGRHADKTWLLMPRTTKNKYSWVVRNLLIADEGKRLIYGDYEQAELRVLCAIAKDEAFRHTFMIEDDPHAATTDLIEGNTEWRNLPNAKEYRTRGKTVNFAWVYQAGLAALARQAGVSESRMLEILKIYEDNHPAIKKYMESELEKVNTLGYVESTFGYRRRFELITERNWHEVKREAGNFRIQSDANALNTKSALFIDANIPDIQILLLNHDAIIAQGPENMCEKLAEQFKEVMIQTPVKEYTDYVPFDADVQIVNSWGAAH